MPFIMITAISGMITLIILDLIKYRIKKRMIETNLDDEQIVRAILESNGPKERKQNILKWTLLGFSGGLGLILQEVLPYDISDSLIPYGVIIVSLSIGLFIYYAIISNFFSGAEADPRLDK